MILNLIRCWKHTKKNYLTGSNAWHDNSIEDFLLLVPKTVEVLVLRVREINIGESTQALSNAIIELVKSRFEQDDEDEEMEDE